MATRPPSIPSSQQIDHCHAGRRSAPFTVHRYRNDSHSFIPPPALLVSRAAEIATARAPRRKPASITNATSVLLHLRHFKLHIAPPSAPVTVLNLRRIGGPVNPRFNLCAAYRTSVVLVTRDNI